LEFEYEDEVKPKKKELIKASTGLNGKNPSKRVKVVGSGLGKGSADF